MTPAQRKILTQALTRLSKDDLVDRLVELAGAISEAWQLLEKRLDLQPETATDLADRTVAAIARATDFDERVVNHNFDYDSDAYQQVKKYFRQMVKNGDLATAMELSERLISEGTYQVEMSDEGLMWDEIEACLDVVCDAVERSQLAPEKVLVWAGALVQGDRVGLYSRAVKLLEKPHPQEVWSRVADELMKNLRRGDRPGNLLSDRRRDVILQQAERALKNADRSADIGKLHAVAAEHRSPKKKLPPRGRI